MIGNNAANAATTEPYNAYDVLVAAPHEIFREGFVEMLRSHFPGLTFDQAADATAARQLTGDNLYDAIIVDSDMPNGEAWSLIQELASSQSGASTMLLLGVDTPEHRASARQYGVAHVAAKSDPVATVIECVEAALNRRGASAHG